MCSPLNFLFILECWFRSRKYFAKQVDSSKAFFFFSLYPLSHGVVERIYEHFMLLRSSPFCFFFAYKLFWPTALALKHNGEEKKGKSIWMCHKIPIELLRFSIISWMEDESEVMYHLCELTDGGFQVQMWRWRLRNCWHFWEFIFNSRKMGWM